MTELRQSGITAYRRFIVDAVVTALRDVFSSSYNRDQQLVDLKVTNKFPQTREEYPCIVVEYVDRRVSNAGVAHEEWFDDNGPVPLLRRWYHSRFEGSINLDLWGLSPLDRDFLADAVIDLLRFGRLDPELSNFFKDIYGDVNSSTLTFQVDQLAINTDEIDGRGNMEEPAPWGAEDQKIYGTGYTLEAHGGFYNTVITDVFEYVTRIDSYPYLEGEVPVLIDAPAPTNPSVYFENGTVIGRGHVSGTDS